MDYAKVWFVFWAVLWAGYFALDGFDLGVGFSGWLAASGDDERKKMFASVGPFWDGNEVWLVTAGGATFAAFPAVYAGLFSWLYPALFLILASLILRGVSLEFRGKVQAAAWRSFWARTAAGSSFSASLLFGVAFGNIFRGLAITADGYQGTLLGLLNPYSLLTGLLFCAFFFYHGQLWLALKGGENISAKARVLAGKAWWALAALVAAFLAASWFSTALYGNFIARRSLIVLPALFAAALLLSRVFLARVGRWAFLCSFAAIALFVFTGFAGIYPALLPSAVDPSFALTVYNASSSPYTLKLMTAVVLVFLPVVIAYQVWVYLVFRAPLNSGELDKSGMY